MYHSSGVDVMDGSNAIYLIVCIVELFFRAKIKSGPKASHTFMAVFMLCYFLFFILGLVVMCPVEKCFHSLILGYQKSWKFWC